MKLFHFFYYSLPSPHVNILMWGYYRRGKNETNLEVVRFRWIFLNNIFLSQEKNEARVRSCGGSSREREDWGETEMGREVAESCIDGVLIEMVSAYGRRFYATKPELAARRIEAIGFQVGHQLIERFSSISSLSCTAFFSFQINCLILQLSCRPMFFFCTDHVSLLDLVIKGFPFWKFRSKKGSIENLLHTAAIFRSFPRGFGGCWWLMFRNNSVGSVCASILYFWPEIPSKDYSWFSVHDWFYRSCYILFSTAIEEVPNRSTDWNNWSRIHLGRGINISLNRNQLLLG